ncbi:MAG: HNH endonuclease signature motif containing protein [Vicinamibacterales bacterium]
MSARVLIQAIIDAAAEADASAILISSPNQQPRRFVVTTADGDSFNLNAYLWTLTFGGRRRLADEYRIQMTSVRSPLPIDRSGPTVLIGFEPNLRIFAGFDIQRHRVFTTGSPSVQIDIEALRTAETEGLAFHRKSNDEIALGIRPDHLLHYTLNATAFHKYGSEAVVLTQLQKAAGLREIKARDIRTLTTERRRLIQVTSRLSRLASFRREVLFAYGHTCAVTRMQLRLVEAAHILPVGAPGSSDHVTNGVALTPTYHRAFDAGLIYLDEKYEMRINPRRVSDISSLGFGGGLKGFQSPLGRIFLPPDRRQWPAPDHIRRANRYRQIT